VLVCGSGRYSVIEKQILEDGRVKLTLNGMSVVSENSPRILQFAESSLKQMVIEKPYLVGGMVLTK
jgi:hypothetical protein